MNKKTLRDVDLKGKRVVMRVDFNVPLKEGVIKDDTRIKGALPSIKYVLEQGGSLVLMSHLGRPDEKGITADTSLKPVAEYLSKLLGKPVTFVADCGKADAEVAAMKPGDIVMLENTRYYKEEQAKAKQKDGESDEDFKARKAELKEKQRQEQMGDIKGEQKTIEWGSQIRSYVFQPYTMVKDLRTGYEMGDVSAVMDGKLEGFVTAYLQMMAE